MEGNSPTAQPGSGYGPSEEAMATRITRSAANAACDLAWTPVSTLDAAMRRIRAAVQEG